MHFAQQCSFSVRLKYHNLQTKLFEDKLLGTYSKVIRTLLDIIDTMPFGVRQKIKVNKSYCTNVLFAEIAN